MSTLSDSFCNDGGGVKDSMSIPRAPNAPPEDDVSADSTDAMADGLDGNKLLATVRANSFELG